MHYSKYNIDVAVGDQTVIANLLSGSLIAPDAQHYHSLKNNAVDSIFSQQEIQALLNMGFLSNCDDETSFILQKRNEKYSKQHKDYFSIEIVTTTDCNARCYYCYQQGCPKEHMTLETAEQVFQFILKNYNQRLVVLKWFGGEPLYNKNIIDYICRRLKQANIMYVSKMITNAYLIDTYIDEIRNLWNLNYTQITLDSINSDYNRIKNYIYNSEKDAFSKVTSNISLLLKSNVKVSIRINFDPSNINPTIETIHFIHKKFGNHKNLSVYCAPITDDNIPSIAKYPGANSPFIKLFDVLIDHGYITSLWDMNIYPQILNCGIYNKEFFVIDTTGKLHKCQHAIIEGDSDAFGNVKDGIQDIEKFSRWNSLDYPFEMCKKCICLPLCQGGCRYRALCNDTDQICLPIKYCLREAIALYYKKFKKQ